MFDLMFLSKKKYSNGTGFMVKGAGTYGFYSGSGLTLVTSGTEIYDYQSAAVSAGTSLTFAKCLVAAAGNKEIGIFAGGADTYGYGYDYASRYAYSDHSVSSGNSLSIGRAQFSAVSNNENCYFSGGENGGGTLNSIEKHNYASGARSNAFLLKARRAHCSVSTGVFGLHIGGVAATSGSTTSSEKHYYANDTVVYGSDMGTYSNGNAATGNLEFGVILGNRALKYRYTNNAVSGTTALKVGRDRSSAAGNSFIGMFAGGTSGGSNYLSSTEKYTFEINSINPGTSLINGIREHAATSSNPGWA